MQRAQTTPSVRTVSMSIAKKSGEPSSVRSRVSRRRKPAAFAARLAETVIFSSISSETAPANSDRRQNHEVHRSAAAFGPTFPKRRLAERGSEAPADRRANHEGIHKPAFGRSSERRHSADRARPPTLGSRDEHIGARKRS